MMRYLAVVLLFAQYLSAQAHKDTIVRSHQLPKEQYREWKIIEDEWMKNEYGKILKENKLKMKCANCENIFMNVIFTIDTSGKLIATKTVKTRKCAGEFSKKMEDRFLKWFLNFTFPKELYNLKFEVRLGTGLKC